MQLDFDIYTTLALASAALVIGRALAMRVAFLARYSIPYAVIGGILFAACITAARAVGDVRAEFDPALLTPLNVMFFTTVGLSADARSLMKGGRLLFVFFLLVSGSLVLQNVIGTGMAKLFDLHPTVGLIAGSITLSGGHGTAAAWGQKFVEEQNLQGAMELGIAAATYGLVAGGLLGGPFAGWLMRRYKLRGRDTAAPGADSAKQPSAPPLSAFQLIETLLLVFVSMAVGFVLFEWIGQGALTLPSFIWALLAGVVLRNVLSLSGLYEVDTQALELIGTLALSLFLAMIIMTLKLWELVDLAGPVMAILLVQTAAMLAFVRFATFPIMGRGYDAVLLATGHLGISLGSTATAMVTVQAVANRHGHSHLAFLLIPIMGAFLIDIANAVTIQGFLSLPWFHW